MRYESVEVQDGMGWNGMEWDEMAWDELIIPQN